MSNRRDRLFGIGLGVGIALGFVLGSFVAARLGTEASEAFGFIFRKINRRSSGVRFEAMLQ